jgi:Domain of unknown function (DUF4123)
VIRKPFTVHQTGATPLILIELRRHLRKFLLVRSPNGNSVFFRFYDPQSLAHLLAELAGGTGEMEAGRG